jgi:Class II Aldolase and Adducin N-terminal domain
VRGVLTSYFVAVNVLAAKSFTLSGVNHGGEQDPCDSIALACRVLHRIGHGGPPRPVVAVRAAEGGGVWLSGDTGEPSHAPSCARALLRPLEGWPGESAGASPGHLLALAVMRRRDDAAAVVVSSPLRATAFAAAGRPLLALSHECSQFVPPDIARFDDRGRLSPEELAEALAAALGMRNALLTRCHGTVTVGAGLGDAVATANDLERACQINLVAGSDAVGSSDEEALEKRRRSAQRLARAWEYLARTAGASRHG